MSFRKAKIIGKKAELKLVPIIRDECKKLGIKTPEIKWAFSIKTEDKEPQGAYHYGKNRIYLNFNRLFEGLIEKVPEQTIMLMIMRTCLHEFKHYINCKVYKITMEEYRQKQENYETEADNYANELMEVWSF